MGTRRRGRRYPQEVCRLLIRGGQSWDRPPTRAGNTRLRPSGDSANANGSSDGGVTICTRIVGAEVGARRSNETTTIAATMATTAAAIHPAEAKRVREEAVPVGSAVVSFASTASSRAKRAPATSAIRLRRSRSRQLRSSERIERGTSVGSRVQSGSRVRTAASVSATSAAWNSRDPVSIS